MPLDHYITLGHSGLRVSPLCLGTMTFGDDWGWGADAATSTQLLEHYLGLGGNFIDTANMYTLGHSEKILGDFFAKQPDKRRRAVIATKFFGNYHTGDPNGGGASRKSMIAACEESLRRLQTDYIDLYWLHNYDPYTPAEETMRALDDLVRAGKVRYIGFSDTPAWFTTKAQLTAQFHGWSPLIALQIEYSLLERTVEGELVPMAKDMGLGITPWSPLKSGVLSGKYTRANHGEQKASRGPWAESNLTDSTYTLIDALQSIAKALNATPAQVALAWLQQQPGVSSIILGVRTVAQLEDNLGALAIHLSAEQLQQLDSLSKPKLNFPAAFNASSGPFGFGGTTINGQQHEVWPMAPTTKRY